MFRLQSSEFAVFISDFSIVAILKASTSDSSDVETSADFWRLVAERRERAAGRQMEILTDQLFAEGENGRQWRKCQEDCNLY